MTIEALKTENAEMLQQFDKGHQEMLGLLEKVTSAYCFNIQLKVLLHHRCHPIGQEDMSEEDFETLTHADRTLIIGNLMLYYACKTLPYMKEAEGAKEEFKKSSFGVELDAILMVLRIVLDMDYDEFRNYDPERGIENGSQVN